MEMIVPDKVTRILFPTAPTRKFTMKQGSVITAWWDVKNLDPTDEHRMNEDHFMESLTSLSAMIKEEVEKHLGGDYSRMFVGGFSQGCTMA